MQYFSFTLKCHSSQRLLSGGTLFLVLVLIIIFVVYYLHSQSIIDIFKKHDSNNVIKLLYECNYDMLCYTLCFDSVIH